jgi:hypothetical protein
MKRRSARAVAAAEVVAAVEGAAAVEAAVGTAGIERAATNELPSLIE